MDGDAAVAGDVARDWVGVFGIAALGERDQIIFVVFDAHFAGMPSGGGLGRAALFVGLPNFVGGGLLGDLCQFVRG